MDAQRKQSLLGGKARMKKRKFGEINKKDKSKYKQRFAFPFSQNGSNLSELQYQTLNKTILHS